MNFGFKRAFLLFCKCLLFVSLHISLGISMKSRIISSTLTILLSLAPLLVFGQVPSAPVITGFSPTAQCSGGTVTIVGRNFVNVQAVSFGGVNARNFSVNMIGDTIRAVPANLGATGLITVQTTSATVASVTTFTYLGCPPVTPVLLDVRPFPLVARDSSVEATMRMSRVCACSTEGFYISLEKQIDNTAFLRDTIIPLSITATSCRFIVPARLVNTPGSIRCNLNQGTYRVLSTTLTVTAPQPPRITSLSPNSTNATGQAFQLTINGEGFFGNVNVQFGGVTVATYSTSATRIIANVPDSLNVPSVLDITITNPDGSKALERMTISDGGYGLPAIARVIVEPTLTVPVRVPQTRITIFGDNFLPNATVMVGNYELKVVSITNDRIVATMSSTIATLLGAGIFRIIVRNVNGKFASQILVVNLIIDGVIAVKNPNQNPFHLYPNPTHETTTIETNAATPRTITYTLRTTLGQDVMRFSRDVLAGRVITPLDVHSLPAGTYFLEIQSGTERVVERLVKY
jgi:hypothetical protein